MRTQRKKKILAMAAAVLVLLVVLTWAAGAVEKSQPEAADAACPIHICEIQASNAACPDESGALRDWVELVNSSNHAYDLSGCGLSDDPLDIKYFFPDGTVLDAGERLVVYCERGGGENVAPFGIARSGGESISFFTADDVAAERIETVSMVKGEAYALTGSGWEILPWGTPGFENSRAGYEAWLAKRGRADCPVVLSELMAGNECTYPGPAGSFPDWIELCNTGKKSWELTGWWLSQDAGDLLGWCFPELTLEPGERIVLCCDGQNGPAFSLSKSGETLYLSDPGGIPAWEVSWAALEDDEVLLLDEESGEYVISAQASPGFENTAEGAFGAQLAADTAAGLLINEVQTSNFQLMRQTDGEYYDWVELRNGGDAPVRLSDYRLSESNDISRAWQLPDVELAPGACFVVICSGNESLSSVYYTHAPFTLNAQDERLFLFGADGSLQDFCRVRDIPYGGSFGRMAGEKGWFRFESATPGTVNGSGARHMAEAPAADLAQGVYENTEGLTVSLSAAGTIYYTLDGSTPTKRSEVYKKPLKLTETTVVRAISMEEGCITSPVATYSYIINEGHSLPVVSLVANPADLFGANGIYYVPSKIRTTREIQGSMAFFDENGSAAADCGVALHGASTRNTRLKKSMKMTFRPRYGGHLNYDVFGDGACSDYFSLVLRSGYMKDHTMLRDEICAATALECSENVLGLRTRYCVVYLNGDYWGVYALRDAYSATYVANELGVVKDDTFISRAPVRPGTCADLEELFDYLNNNDELDDEEYAWVSAQFDLETLADWMVLEAYFTNYDLPGNIRYIRGSDSDPWRMAFFDLDFGLRLGTVTWDYVFDQVNQFGRLTRAMASREEFRDLLFRRMAILFENGLSEKTVAAALENYSAQIEPELAREYARWGEGQGDLETTQKELLSFIESNRQSQCADALCKALGLDAEVIRATYFEGVELE